jgi:hypothetical protein
MQLLIECEKRKKNRSNWLEILSEKGCYFAKAPDSPLVQKEAKGEQKREVLHGCQEEYSIEPPLPQGPSDEVLGPYPFCDPPMFGNQNNHDFNSNRKILWCK